MARISWGRRPGDDQPVIDARKRWPLITLLLLSLLVAGLDGFVHRSVIEADTPEQIQSKLDQHLRTLDRGDRFQYDLTLDRRSAAHTRCMGEQFERGAERVAELRPNRLIRLEETSPDSTLVRAYVERRDGVVVEYFRRAQLVNILTRPPFDIRQVTSIWYLSSPTQAEVGGQFITGAGEATLESWGIDEEARAAVERALDELSAEFVRPPLEAPGATSPPPLRVRLLPAPEYGPDGCVTDAAYDPQRTEISMYPYWADTERASLADRTREELRNALRRWDKSR